MRLCLLLLIMIVALSGCTSNKLVDKIQLANTLGYDKKDTEYVGTALYPTYQEKGNVKVNILSTVSASNYDILPRLNSKSSMPIEQGQLKSVIFGKEFAEEGINTVVNSMVRDPVIGTRLHLAVAEQKAEQILMAVQKLNDPFHLSQLIEHNIKNQNIPANNLHIFLYHYYGEGMDSYLPYLIAEGNAVKLDGLALFKKDKLVSTINLRQAFILKLLLNETKGGRYQVHLKRENQTGYVLLQNLNSKSKLQINRPDERPLMDIMIEIDAKIKDSPTWLNLTQEDNINWIEKKFEEHFEEETVKLLKLCQQLKVDPVGIGAKFRAKVRSWNPKQYAEMYPEVQFHVSVNVNILQTGVGE
ncbi:Ger(x)C family spore germination protein [Marinicrinis lubricantis]